MNFRSKKLNKRETAMKNTNMKSLLKGIFPAILILFLGMLPACDFTGSYSTDDYFQGEFLPGLGIQTISVTDVVTPKVEFNDSVNEATAVTATNYTLTGPEGNPVSITGVSMFPGSGSTVELTSDYLYKEGYYTLTARNIECTGASKSIPATGVSVTFSGMGSNSPQFSIQSVSIAKSPTSRH